MPKAIQNMTHERLFGWRTALFPTGYSGSVKIDVGSYRSGGYQVVSGALGKEKDHYETVRLQRLGRNDYFFKMVQ